MLTYHDLYEIVRKEKYGEVLQLLPKYFILDFREYIKDRKEQSSQQDSLFTDLIAKNKKQFENSLALFKELMLRRKKKILNLVFVAAETGIMKRDYENMLSFEKDMFDKFVKSLEEGDKEMLQTLYGEKNEQEKNALILFNQNIEQFVDMSGNPLGPFKSGEVAHLDKGVSQILVSGGKASFIDE